MVKPIDIIRINIINTIKYKYLFSSRSIILLRGTYFLSVNCLLLQISVYLGLYTQRPYETQNRRRQVAKLEYEYQWGKSAKKKEKNTYTNDGKRIPTGGSAAAGCTRNAKRETNGLGRCSRATAFDGHRCRCRMTRQLEKPVLRDDGGIRQTPDKRTGKQIGRQ